MLRSFAYLTVLFFILSASGYLGRACADGFNHPIAPFEAPLCLFFMIATPLVAVVACVKLYRNWRNTIHGKTDK